MLGKDAPYVPGWDCHGLPIEWIVEEKYRAKKQSKDSVRSRSSAGNAAISRPIGSSARKSSFQRLGVVGDWTTRI